MAPGRGWCVWEPEGRPAPGVGAEAGPVAADERGPRDPRVRVRVRLGRALPPRFIFYYFNRVGRETWCLRSPRGVGPLLCRGRGCMRCASGREDGPLCGCCVRPPLSCGRAGTRRGQRRWPVCASASCAAGTTAVLFPATALGDTGRGWSGGREGHEHPGLTVAVTQCRTRCERPCVTPSGGVSDTRPGEAAAGAGDTSPRPPPGSALRPART